MVIEESLIKGTCVEVNTLLPIAVVVSKAEDLVRIDDVLGIDDFVVTHSLMRERDVLGTICEVINYS